MKPVSPEDLSKIRQAIESGDPIVVLAALMLTFPDKKSGEFVSVISRSARAGGSPDEELFDIAIQLYDKYYPEEHLGGLNALCGKAQLLDAQGRDQEIEVFIESTHRLVMRAATAIGKIVDNNQHEGKDAPRALLLNFKDFDKDG